MAVALQSVLDTMHLSLTKKAKLPILENVSGVVKPSRLALQVLQTNLDQEFESPRISACIWRVDQDNH